VLLRFVNEFLVPCSSEMETRRVAVDTVSAADSVPVVNKAQSWETESWNTARDTRASGC
jgi:hypothetical protein